MSDDQGSSLTLALGVQDSGGWPPATNGSPNQKTKTIKSHAKPPYQNDWIRFTRKTDRQRSPTSAGALACHRLEDQMEWVLCGKSSGNDEDSRKNSAVEGSAAAPVDDSSRLIQSFSHTKDRPSNREHWGANACVRISVGSEAIGSTGSMQLLLTVHVPIAVRHPHRVRFVSLGVVDVVGEKSPRKGYTVACNHGWSLWMTGRWPRPHIRL